MNTDNTVLN